MVLMKIILTLEDIRVPEGEAPSCRLDFDVPEADKDEISASAMAYAIGIRRLFESGDLTRLMPQLCPDIVELTQLDVNARNNGV